MSATASIRSRLLVGVLGFLLVGILLAAAGLFIGLRLGGVAVDWYPYPTLYLPPINPALVIGCLALALPSVAMPAAVSCARHTLAWTVSTSTMRV